MFRDNALDSNNLISLIYSPFSDSWIHHISLFAHAGDGRLRVTAESRISLLGATWLFRRSQRPQVSFERTNRRYFAIPKMATNGFITDADATKIEVYRQT
jgi:hypothetical protein